MAQVLTLASPRAMTYSIVSLVPHYHDYDEGDFCPPSCKNSNLRSSSSYLGSCASKCMALRIHNHSRNAKKELLNQIQVKEKKNDVVLAIRT